MSKPKGCDSDGQNEMEGTGGQRGRVQARSKAGKIKKKRTLKKWFAFVFQKSLHFEVSSEDIMICIYLEVLEQCQSTFPVSPAVTLTGKGSKQQEKRVQAELC